MCRYIYIYLTRAPSAEGIMVVNDAIRRPTITGTNEIMTKRHASPRRKENKAGMMRESPG